MVTMTTYPRRLHDLELLDKCSRERCVICLKLGCFPVYVRPRAELGDENFNLIPLCYQHSNEKKLVGWRTMAKKYLNVMFALETRGWRFGRGSKLVRD